MNVRLVIEQGKRRKVLNLRPPSAVLGRSHGNAVRIPSSAVSRKHCRLLLEEGLVTLEDLGSVNGTFLNGRRLDRPEVVRPGDRIEVGPVAFAVEYELTPDALERLREMDAGSGGAEMDLLQALADGEVVTLDSAEDLPSVRRAEEDVPVLEEVGEDATLPPARAATEDDGDIPVDFDFDAGAWEMPQGGDLRGLMDLEDEEPTRRAGAKKKK